MSTVEEAPVGRFETLRFARLLARFWEQGFTGSFRAQSNVRPGVSVSKEIFFERGRVAWAASDDPEEGIRTHLINRGLLRADQWRLAEEKAGSGQPRQTLLDLGFLTARELQEADRERVTGIVLSLFGWREGRYQISAGPPPHGTPSLRIDPRDLVLEGLMSSGDRGRVLDEIGSVDTVLIVRPDDLVRASLSLPVELVELMGKADGTRTVADICALSSLPDFLISAAFAGLKVLGLAKTVEAAVAAAPPAPPVPAPERPPARRRGGPPQDHPVAREPRLPLYDEAETVPMTATPPGGLPVTGKSEVVSAGPASTPATERVAGAWGPPRPPAAPPRPDPEPFAVGARTVTPSLAPPAQGPPPPVPESGPIEVGAEDEEEPGRETEVELKPGIPVEPFPLSLDHEGQPTLSESEIADVVEVLDAPQASVPPTVEPPLLATPSARREPGVRSGTPGGAIEEEAESLPDGSAAAEDEGAWEEGEETDAGSEPPAWVYEPSGPPEGRGRRTFWGLLGVIAATLVGTGALALLIFGSGGRERSDTAVSPPPIEAEGPPEDLQAPAAFEPAPESPSKIATATMGESAAKATPRPAQPRPATRSRSLASPEQGAIFPSGPSAEGRRLLGSGDLAAAARRFEEAVAGREGLYTVQIAIACEPPTVTRALGTTRGSSRFFILPTTFRGQPCYRMLWGAYASREAAEKARATLPAVFLRDPHPPAVTSLR